MQDSEIELLRRLERWYAAQCNGDWEHTYGITLETVDNPGWYFKVDLTDTYLSDRAFAEISENQGDDQKAFLCVVKDRVFIGCCPPNKLHDVISIFCAGRTTRSPDRVPDAVQRPSRCSAQPGPTMMCGKVDPGPAAHHAASAARCAASGER